jgi:aspartate/methionine/tyrosine aminotransferase
LIPSFSEFELSPTLQANEKVIELRKQGREILHMGFGESPFPVHESLEKTLSEAADHKEYLSTSGLNELKERIVDFYKKNTDIPVDEYDLVIGPGSKLILYAAQMALEGDLLMPVPSWVSYAPQSRMLGREVVKVHADLRDEGYFLSLDNIKRSIIEAKEKGLNPTKLILNYPNNPTGLVIPEDNLKEIAEFCESEEILIISDEIYGLVNFEKKYISCSEYAPSHTLITTGLSKHLSLGGWRLGVGFVPKKVKGLYSLISQIASETWSSVASPIQYACVQAYSGDKALEEHIKSCTLIHKLVNGYINQRLKKADFFCPSPAGAFYNYPNFSNLKDLLKSKDVLTSMELASFLIEKYGLVTLPGAAFGEKEDVLSLRLSGCDYNGEKALAALARKETLDEAFVNKHAPNVVKAMDILNNLEDDLKRL